MNIGHSLNGAHYNKVPVNALFAVICLFLQL